MLYVYIVKVPGPKCPILLQVGSPTIAYNNMLGKTYAEICSHMYLSQDRQLKCAKAAHTDPGLPDVPPPGRPSDDS